MSIPNTIRMNRSPTHPGEMLREDCLPDYGLTVSSRKLPMSPPKQGSILW